MTRIIYGYSGEGSGHSSRAREMTRFLVDLGHEVKLCSYDRGYLNLKDDFDVLEIEGLTIGSSNNRLSLVKTFTENLSRMTSASRKAMELRKLFKSFQPHVVITDFEPMTAYLAHHYMLPLISIDNQHRMRYVDSPIPPGLKAEAALTRALIRMMVLKPDVALVTSLVDGPTKNDRTFVFPPMIGHDVRQLVPSNEGYVLVYLTQGFESLLEVLTGFQRERFLIYGSANDAGQDVSLEYFLPHRETFLQHLAACKAIIGTAGFTLISESLCLRKPYLAFPMKGQYEQELNAFQLAQKGWGRMGLTASHETVAAFLYDLPEIEAQLQNLSLANDNSAIQSKLAELVESDARRAAEFRSLRKSESGTNGPSSDIE